MKCVSCGLGAGYNRAVVDLVHGTELGGFCFRCEDAEFGRSLSRGDWSSVEGCLFCERDGFYALPEWKPFCETEGDRTVCKVDYRVDESTLRLCDEHFVCVNDGPTQRDAGRQVYDNTSIR